MSRRIGMWLSAVLLVTTGLLAPAGTAQAAEPLTASITCGADTDLVTAQASGFGLFPGTRLNVNFSVYSGGYATETTYGQVPSIGRTTVPTTVNPRGGYAVTGFSRPMPAGSLFYLEKVRVTVTNASTGEQIAAPQDVMCYRDLRTTLHVDCDPATGSAHVAISAKGFHLPSTVSLRYYVPRAFSQASADSPGFGTFFSPYSVKTITPNADGTWSDVGYSVTGSTSYHAWSEWRVEVWTSGQFNTHQLGWTETKLCVIADQR
ncbi:hypothetical protein K1W54_34520 [Micromonospora sp. CPCC 205371]|nr:hypothetical protein [Micromonospora sp. CPCC 205371]